MFKMLIVLSMLISVPTVASADRPWFTNDKPRVKVKSYKRSDGKRVRSYSRSAKGDVPMIGVFGGFLMLVLGGGVVAILMAESKPVRRGTPVKYKHVGVMGNSESNRKLDQIIKHYEESV